MLIIFPVFLQVDLLHKAKRVSISKIRCNLQANILIIANMLSIFAGIYQVKEYVSS